jgi:hypothetical protein
MTYLKRKNRAEISIKSSHPPEKGWLPFLSLIEKFTERSPDRVRKLFPSP